MWRKIQVLCAFLIGAINVHSQNVQWGNKPLETSGVPYAVKEVRGKPYLLLDFGSGVYEIESLEKLGKGIPAKELYGFEGPAVSVLAEGEKMNIYYDDKKVFTFSDPRIARIGWVSVSLVSSGALADRSDGLYGAFVNLADAVFHGTSGFGLNKSFGVWNTNFRCDLTEKTICFHSPDESKQLFTNLKKTEKSIDTYELFLYGAKGDKIGVANVVMPLPSDKMKLHLFGVTDSGTPYCIYKRYDIGKTEKDAAPYQVVVSKIDMATGKMDEITVDTKGKWLKSIAVNVQGENIGLHSLYVEKSAAGAVNFDGALYANISLQGLKSESGYAPFPEGTIFTWESKSNNSTSYLRIRKIILEEDGVSYLLSNDHRIIEGDQYDNMGNGIVFLKTDPNGKVLFSRKINRSFWDEAKQIRTGVHLTKFKSDYYLLYCVPREQVDYSVSEKVSKAKVTQGGLALVCTKVTGDGPSEILIPDMGKSITAFPSAFGVNGKGEIYLPVTGLNRSNPSNLWLGMFQPE